MKSLPKCGVTETPTWRNTIIILTKLWLTSVNGNGSILSEWSTDERAEQTNRIPMRSSRKKRKLYRRRAADLYPPHTLEFGDTLLCVPENVIVPHWSSWSSGAEQQAIKEYAGNFSVISSLIETHFQRKCVFSAKSACVRNDSNATTPQGLSPSANCGKRSFESGFST